MSLFYRAKHAKKPKLHIPLGACLSYLLISALIFTGISFSKFATSEQNSGNANVAVVVIEGGGGDNMDLVLDDTTTTTAYPFYVTNKANDKVSDVALEYTVSVEFPGGESLPSGVEMKLEYDNAGQLEELTPVTQQNGIFTYDCGVDLAAGAAQQHNYTITFTTTDSTTITRTYNFADIAIFVDAEQLA